MCYIRFVQRTGLVRPSLADYSIVLISMAGNKFSGDLFADIGPGDSASQIGGGSHVEQQQQQQQGGAPMNQFRRVPTGGNQSNKL